MTRIMITNWWLFKLDDNMVPLIWALLGRGFEPLASCGGHLDPQRGQEPDGRWYIEFEAVHMSHIENLMESLDGLGPITIDVYERETATRVLPTVFHCVMRGGAITPTSVVRRLIHYGKDYEASVYAVAEAAMVWFDEGKPDLGDEPGLPSLGGWSDDEPDPIITWSAL